MASMIVHECDRGRHRVAAAAGILALACACALACLLTVVGSVRPAMADEVGADSFDLNLSLSVEETVDPAHPAHPIELHVVNQHAEAVAGAQVSFTFDSIAEDGAGAALAVESEAVAAEPAKREGTAITGADGTAALSGIARGGTYAVVVEAEGHERYERLHTCKGEGGEVWEVVVTKTDAVVPGGNPGGPGPVALGTVRNLPQLLKTGDGLAPMALVLAGALVVAGTLVVIARRRRKGDHDVG